VLRDAQKSGHTIHPYSHYIEVFRQKKSDRIIHVLNPDEIKKIKNLSGISGRIRDSYNWLLIGLSIGQRVSDLLSLSPFQIRQAPGDYTLMCCNKKQGVMSQWGYRILW
jgi:hypothetical protein